MKNNKLTTATRLALTICGFALVTVLFTPMWRIELAAPQYPEGLKMLIYANKLGGNVDIINGLNHYIGMKTLHTEDFIEFKALPWIIVVFIVSFLLTALAGKRKWLNLLLIFFVSFGVVAMIDFWKWEYNYGHNLNPEAAIVVPGMAYQPPLIGFKQLLNFGAYSIPDIGGWTFVGVGAILLALVIYEWNLVRRRIRSTQLLSATVALFSLAILNGCKRGPEPFIAGTDHCSFCQMTISDMRYGGELETKKGKIYKFDDSYCLLSFIEEHQVELKNVANVYFTDFGSNHQLILSDKAFLLQTDSIRGPMNGKIIAFSNEDSFKKVELQYSGNVFRWKLPSQ